MEYDRTQRIFSAASRDASTPICEIIFRKPEKCAKTITQGQLSQSNIAPSFQALNGCELLRMRLSTPLTNSKSNQALSLIRFSITFKGKKSETKLLPPRKNLDAANYFSLARTEKLGRWRGNEKAMSAMGQGRMRNRPA
ncbi:hypothetical protein [Rhodobacter lacus]|uniref:Uncharacterized protein n=1 Tax=Rhodobacter lacus TaxID=1641972 RepID=A0ABW5ACN3_9RHOB